MYRNIILQLCNNHILHACIIITEVLGSYIGGIGTCYLSQLNYIKLSLQSKRWFEKYYVIFPAIEVKRTQLYSVKHITTTSQTLCLYITGAYNLYRVVFDVSNLKQ